MRIAALVAGIFLILVTLHDVFETVLLPRRVRNQQRLVRYFFKSTWFVWARAVARVGKDLVRNDLFGVYGPLAMITLLMFWAIGLVLAFSLIFFGITPGPLNLSRWFSCLYFSGSTFFSFGRAGLDLRAAGPKMLAVSEAATGLGFVALVIGYLPVIYQLFSRREVEVITLDSLAGSPPTSLGILCRYAEGQSLDEFDELLLRWQKWCAELLESQLSYPMLAYYRSQHDNQSWLASLTATMDVCVIVMMGLDGVKTLQARLTFATARLAAVDICKSLALKPEVNPPDRLNADAFRELRQRLESAGLRFVDLDGTEERMASFRATYEPFLAGLATYLRLTLPPWSPDPEDTANWANSPRGKSAQRLMESVDP